LSELIEDIDSVRVERDEKRELLTLQVTAKDGTTHPARALSDGTLRFLALAVIELDPDARGLLCLEEPENGIHPARIPSMLRLLQDIAVDTQRKVGDDNPLRQVIINTHSPAVVAQVPDDSLIIADLRMAEREGQWSKSLALSCLPGTWRAATHEMDVVRKGELLAYLNPIPRQKTLADFPDPRAHDERRMRRVIDRLDMQLALGFELPGESES
jgi:hypothetical protein